MHYIKPLLTLVHLSLRIRTLEILLMPCQTRHLVASRGERPVVFIRPFELLSACN